MPLWKQWLLGLYYAGSLPLRMVRSRLSSSLGQAPIMIFTWHRIAGDAANDWTTHEHVFEREIDWLAERFDLISLAEAQDRIRSGQNSRPAACVTFDDGYAENCNRALPLLIERGIPVTYFVTSRPVLEQQPFSHDAEMGNDFAPNTLQQLRQLIAAGIEIGAHTRTHADIGKINSEAELVAEIVTARDELEAALDTSIRYFAFPFGQHANLSRRAFEIAGDAGYDAALSAYGGYHYPGDDAFHLQRMCVDGPMIRLKNWASVDPWKQLKIRRYAWRPASQHSSRSGASCQ